jgi:uncharacterized protein YndB with AHSA1/START domain
MIQTISFQKHFDKKQVIITHSYDTDVETIWNAFTQTDVLEKWWAPEPYKAIVVHNDFKIGGSLLYYMLSPAGEKHYCLAEFLKIDHLNSYEVFDAFCDENAIINTALPRVNWINEFTSENGETIVTNTISFRTVQEMNMLIDMGFEAGYRQALKQLYGILN